MKPSPYINATYAEWKVWNKISQKRRCGAVRRPSADPSSKVTGALSAFDRVTGIKWSRLKENELNRILDIAATVETFGSQVRANG